ncbi:hypothetical protein [Streptomyces reniochalinae]|uniref:Sensor domain-containing protein n=1 Tax=Streptomyces reniochalinae TaxID=2250578 RepID=A0A367F5W8_9ACTN|nr:hypothetical protein [Streptomyces reniochalinae]RCG25145.1 hypothetical protein DQ392_01105 [Streptomyces reniochalinae]
MRTRTRTLTRTATAAATLALLATTATATATAAETPGFLEADDLPPNASSPWHAGEVTQGLPDPEPFCMEGAVPDESATYHRSFGTDYDTHAVQVAVTTASPKAAAALAGRLETRAAHCAADWLREHPGSSASWDDYGTVDAGESAHVWGVHTAPPESEHGVNLFAVVSKGKKVTVVRWAEMGTLEHAPVDAFRTTTTKAAARL